MKSIKRRIYSLILAAAMLLSVIGTFASSAAEAAAANRYNVVFVIDASGSMKSTDGSLWRYEAIDLFLGLATDTGNYMGAVVFNDGIVARMDMQEINGKDMKTALSQSLRSSAVRGDTDIGSAIQVAVDMLDSGRNPNNPSVIILLSDGNTDFPSDSTGALLAQSDANKQDAINRARQNGYPVFSVCLNANHTANTEELADISNATAGQFVEVTKAEDLKEVFARFYNIIYSTETINIADQPIPDSGILDIPFSVPSAGVEELNIIISTLSPNTQYSVFQPTGMAYTSDELSAMTIQVDTFSVVKVPNPMGGTWKIQARGIPGDAVKIDMVYNSNFSVKATVEPAGPDFGLSENVVFTAKVLSNDQELTESSSYAVYPATLSINRTSDGSEMASTLMQAGQLEYTANVALNEAGEFYATVTVKFEGLEKTSERILLNVGSAPALSPAPAPGNTPPRPAENPVKWSVKSDSGKSYGSRDLQTFAEDAEDTELTFAIKDLGDYKADQVYIEDGLLKVEAKGLKEGALILTAQDSEGASCDVEVQLSPAGNILGLVLGIAGGLAGLVLVLLLVKFILDHLKKPLFQGDVMINAFDYNNNDVDTSPQMIQPAQGKEALSRHITEGAGIDLNKTYLMADGKSSEYIWLISDKGLYSSDNQDKKEKKIRLFNGIATTVSRNQDLDCGLQITYTENSNIY